MDRRLRVVVEAGPKGKRWVAVAIDWPGLSRGAKTELEAIELLSSYRPRYAPVAALAGKGQEFAAASGLEVVESYTGTGSTDFWGISFNSSAIDNATLSDAELERELGLLRASWAFFDEVRARVSSEMKRGPRGGGRDRDTIAWHTIRAERDWARKLGLRLDPALRLSEAELQSYREDYCAAIRGLHAAGKPARSWSLRFLIRHTAFHSLDHAWEMEDKDLTGTIV